MRHYATPSIPFATNGRFARCLDNRQPVDCCFSCLFGLVSFVLSRLQFLTVDIFTFAPASVFYSQLFQVFSAGDCVIYFAF